MVAQLTKDQPLSGLEKAVWWTEYVIRHKGATHFKNPMTDLPFYQVYLMDVIGFILVILIFSAYIIYLLSIFLLKELKKLCYNRMKTKKSQ